ncbi:MAG: hypothetical protein IT233_08450 [Bacteroidia bacterium]|nr:hypothetical protein [Bacteroidia bacterium]
MRINRFAFPFVLFLVLSGILYSQDTLFTAQGKVIGKVTRVTEKDIEYRKSSDAGGAVYVVPKHKVYSIHYSDGTTDNFRQPESPVAPDTALKHRKNVIKFNCFGLLHEYINFSYERKVVPGFNLVFSAGIINTTMFNFSSARYEEFYYTNTINNGYVRYLPVRMGFNARVGGKFGLINSTKNSDNFGAYPGIGGLFLMPELQYGRLKVHDIISEVDTSSTYPHELISSDLINSCFSLNICMGYQFVFVQRFVVGGSAGMGLGGIVSRYSNPEFEELTGFRNDSYTEMFYGSQVFVNSSATMTLTAGFWMGWLF